MAQEDKAKFTGVFRKADKNNDGEVTPGELKRMVIIEFGQDISDRDLVDMFCCLDKNGDGKVTLDEFLGEMLKKPRRAEFRKAFDDIDKDHSGSISKDEVRQLVKSRGCSDADIDKMFAKVDTNDDGIISLDEFMAMV
ncbi:Calmodulin [Mizuhopecten yessoensis]|uniref:Sulfhydryl light chain n=3 Tax=Mizuhopecten yessoensis TaxID=6573 RepID=A0A210QZU0_MIZYE|nr:Calmodulin [Mizuhopecten yessoensis]